MRILSLGCHEGFVEYWLAHQKDSTKVEVDAIELQPENVEVCRRRGINCVQGFAEDAGEHFTPGSYDLVVAYELIEHVPDVDRLLTVCETMVKPGGLVLISTPDGTFGTGANPHHLRVYRSIDLAELLRRRGDLHRMAVGTDGLTLAAYRPAKRIGELAIHTGAGWMRWAPQDIEQKGLGGSETAAVKLADALSQQGWVVTVYGETEQGCHSNVVYRHGETFDPLTQRDVFIASRLPELFDRPIAARVKCLWLHDTDCGHRLTPQRAEHIDHIFVLSSWHRAHVAQAYPFIEGKLVQIRNGIDHSLFNGRVA